MLKDKIKKTSVIVALSVLLAGGLGFGVFKMVAPSPVFADTATTQAVTQQNTTQAADNANDTSTEANGAAEAKETTEANGAAEAKESANEPANEKAQEANLPGGGHQDQDNVNVDHQFEGVE
ncbi:MAG: hypothetical protein ACYDIA_23020 [Candidatus Humimicrobiaceae bacterium]